MIGTLANNNLLANNKPIVIININDTVSVYPAYVNELVEYQHLTILPKDTARIILDNSSLSVITIFMTTNTHIASAIAAMPGDTILVNYDKQQDKYIFDSKYKDEIMLYKNLEKSKFKLRNIDGLIAYSKNKGLKNFTSRWNELNKENKSYLMRIEKSNIRPEILMHYNLENKFNLLSILLFPITRGKVDKNIWPLPVFYQNIVSNYIKKLRSLASKNRRTTADIAYMLRSCAIFTATQEMHPDSIDFAIQYKIAQNNFKGYERELACYSTLRSMLQMNRNLDVLPALIKDYQSWAPSNSRYLKRINEITSLDGYKILENETLNDNLVTLKSKKIKLFDLINESKGKVIYLDFWASWCGPCIMEMPYSFELKKKYNEKAIKFIYLSTDEDNTKWIKSSVKVLPDIDETYRFENKINSELIKKFKIDAIPRYMIIDKKGILHYNSAARPSNPELISILDQLLAEKP